jgi:peptidoglycan/LPS O-acetylase OafA/YrhL
MLYAWRRFGPLPTIAGALILGYAFRIGFADTRLARTNCHFIGLFALGVLAAYLSTSPAAPYVRARQARFWPWLAAGSFVLVCGLLRMKDVSFPVLDGVVGVLALATLVVSSTRESAVLTRVLSFGPLVFMGTFSYSVYLLHAPLLQLMWQYVLEPLGLGSTVMFALLMSLGLACVLGVSYFFFRVFEAPFMRSSRRVERVGRVAAVAPS